MKISLTYKGSIGMSNSIGYFIFFGEEIKFYSTYSKYKNKFYLIDQDDLDKIKKISKHIDTIYDRFHDIDSAEYSNSVLEEVSLTTNWDGKIEVRFLIDISIEKVRDVKLELIISE